MQEDKEGFFDTVDTLLSTLHVFADMLPGMTLNTERLESLASESYMLATDLADYLVGKGVPFREAHGVMRRLCQHCEAEDKSLSDLAAGTSIRISRPTSMMTCTPSPPPRRWRLATIPAGTAPNRVAEGLARAKRILRENGPLSLDGRGLG